MLALSKNQILEMRFRQCEQRIDEYIRQLADLTGLDASRVDRGKLVEFVRTGLWRGIVDHGFKLEVDVATFLAWRQLFGPRFDELPAVRDAIQATRDEKSSRLVAVINRLPLGIWEIAARRGTQKQGE